MNIDKKISIDYLNFLLFCVFLEIIVFSVSLFSANIFYAFIEKFGYILYKNKFYSLNPSFLDSLKISLLLVNISIFNFYCSIYLTRYIKNYMNLYLSLLSASLISIIYISKILKKTDLRGYPLLWVAIMIIYAVSSSVLIEESKR
jgi:hypothetical protein